MEIEVNPHNRAPGPGLPESLLWTIGVLLAQVFAAIVTVFVLAAYLGATGGVDRLQELARTPQQFLDVFQVPFFCGVESQIVVIAVLAAALRLGREAPRRLALTAIPLRHVVCIVFLALPLSVLCGQLYLWMSSVWDRALSFLPILEELEQMQSMPFIQSLAKNSPLPTLLVMIAVAPAVAEELLFRGVIGRGLVARWGMPMGVLLTSLLFAAVHLYPPQAVAIIPLAILIHLFYLATRSFWAPVLVHFLNNTWAAVVTKYGAQFDEEQFNVDFLVQEAASPPPGVLLTAVCCVVAIGLLAWKTRVQHHLPDGSVWNPGYSTAEQPPRQLATITRCRQTNGGLPALAILSIVAFAASFAWSVVGG